MNKVLDRLHWHDPSLLFAYVRILMGTSLQISAIVITMSDYMRVTFEVKYYIKELKMKNTKYI